jgi:hypothetical protein
MKSKAKICALLQKEAVNMPRKTLGQKALERHMDARKKAGLPDPAEYLKKIEQKKKEIEAMKNESSDVDHYNAKKAQAAKYNHKMYGEPGIKLTQSKIDKINAQTKAMQQAKEKEKGVAEDLRTDNPCWDGYKPVGTKIKDGKEVPNCVPESVSEEWVRTGKTAKHIATGETTFEYAKVDKEGKRTGERHYRNASGVVMGEETNTGVTSMNFKAFKSKLAEKHLTPAEMKKREEVAKAIHRENPGMEMGKKMAIATATAKKVAEDVEQIQESGDAKSRFQEYHNDTAKLLKGIHKSLSDHYSANHKDAHWGHVGDIRHIHDQLRDLHDRLSEQGEYAKKSKDSPLVSRGY